MTKLTPAKKILLFLLVLCLAAAPLHMLAFAASFHDVPVAHWSHSYVEKAAENALVNGTGDGRFAPDAPVSYAEWSTMLCNLLYAADVETYLTLTSSRLGAWYLPYVIVADRMDVLDGTDFLRYAESGKGWESDMSTAPVSRYDMAQTIHNVAQQQDWTSLSPISDETLAQARASISDWDAISDASCADAVAYCYAAGFLTGVDAQNRFAGADELSRGAAAAVLCRLLDAKNGTPPAFVAPTPPPAPTPTPEPTPEPTPTPAPAVVFPHPVTRLTIDSEAGLIGWPAVADAADYEVSVIEARRGYRDIAPLPAVVFRTGGATACAYSFNPRRQYTVSCTPLNSSGQSAGQTLETSIYIYSVWGAVTEYLADPIPSSSDPRLETITVNVWKLNADGSKSPGTASVTIHATLAPVFRTVFQEIFEGEEQFPIYSLGGWRVSSGEHGCGTAIDINANENYCLYADGRVVGSHWKPYEDPYSITPYGDVVRAFEKHGFTWGGDAWAGNIDYMHFSYYGR